ncbi:MAG: succinylglutamate desuccinylase/aspartoacylase family protein, partial [Alphaproteobacteria bacterium]
MHTGVFNTIDFSADGKQVSTVNIPYSVDRSPYYQIRLPICRIKNGEGPSILLIGGNHGDEYEGPIALARLIQHLRPDAIRGAITILPTLNAPAVFAHRRCSPFDGGNLNRSFPGDPGGTPTQKIAAFVTDALIPNHDVMFDLHSGGTSMDHLRCGIVEVSGDSALDAKARDLLQAMGLPYAFVADNGRAPPTSLGAANSAGVIGISGEFGGGASLTPASLQDTCAVVDRVLMHMGITARAQLSVELSAAATTTLLGLDNQNLFVYGDGPGWFEPLASIGDWVERAQPAARIYDLHVPNAPPRELAFRADGLVIA